MFNLFLSIMGLFGAIILGILQLLAVIVLITIVASGFALVVDFAILAVKSVSAYIKALVRKHGGK
jgi:hypothetical protein